MIFFTTVDVLDVNKLLTPIHKTLKKNKYCYTKTLFSINCFTIELKGIVKIW